MSLCFTIKKWNFAGNFFDALAKQVQNMFLLES